MKHATKASRRTCGVAVALSAVLVLAACGDDDDDSATAPAGSATTAAERTTTGSPSATTTAASAATTAPSGTSASTSAAGQAGGSSAGGLGTPNAASGEPVLVGVITNRGSETLEQQGVFTEQGASMARDYINDYMGGIAGRPLQVFFCGAGQTAALA